MIKLLIIEDEKLLREGLLQMIDFNHYQCELCGEARNGKEGLELIQIHRPDLVLIDLHIPLINGMDVLRKTIQQYQYEAIIISGYTEFHHAKEAITLQVAEYLVKPVSQKELNQALDKVVQRINAKPKNKKVSSYTEEVIEIIHRCLDQNITVSFLADQIGISCDHLNRLFKKDTSMTIHQYVIQARIKKACMLLEDQSSRVYEVANQVGFKEYKYFHHVFRQIMKQSPKDYQKQQKS